MLKLARGNTMYGLNGSGMKAMLPRRKLPRQKYIFPFSKHKEVKFQFFSLYQLQKVLLTIANKKY